MTQSDLFPALNCTADFRNRWIAASAMQKAVRRSNWAIAEAAVLYLYEHDKQTLYRRVLVTALEDVEDIETVEFATRLAASAAERRRHGGNLQACLIAVRALCDAPKDRTTDLLASAIQYHPDYRVHRQEAARMDEEALQDVVTGEGHGPVFRALALWLLSGLDRYPSKTLRTRLSAPINVQPLLLQMEIDPLVLNCTATAMRASREVIGLLFALVHHCRTGEETTIGEYPISHRDVPGGVPDFGLDPLHTRAGRTALKHWRKTHHDLMAFTAKQTALAVFYQESALCSPKLEWETGRILERLGLEADLVAADLDIAAVPDLMGIVSERLDSLYEHRVAVLVDEENAPDPEPLG